jgi:hypothetical protein
MQMRVRVSELKATEEVSGNGSPRSVTDSRAIARVDVLWLIRIGGVAFAA